MSDDTITVTPVDHDPFADLKDYASKLPNTTSVAGSTVGDVDFSDPITAQAYKDSLQKQQPELTPNEKYMQDPTQPLLGRLAMAVPTAIGDTISGAAQGAWNAATLPGDVATGKVDPSSLDALHRSTDLAGMLTLPAAAPELPAADTLGIFAGAKSKTADLNALKQAQEMQEAGHDQSSIWHNTGWFQGVDKKWRYEIPDDEAATPEFTQKLLLSQPNSQGQLGIKGAAEGPFRGFLEHPSLYSSYPDLATIPTKTEYNWEGTPNAGYLPQITDAKGKVWPESIFMKPNEISPTTRAIDPDTGEISSEPRGLSPVELGLHEIQHAIQKREGFTTGTSPKSLQNLGVDPKEAFDQYWKTPGEVEARNVEIRRTLSPLDRFYNPPWTTEDVPRENQVLPSVNPSKPVMSSETKPWTITKNDALSDDKVLPPDTIAQNHLDQGERGYANIKLPQIEGYTERSILNRKAMLEKIKQKSESPTFTPVDHDPFEQK